MGSAFDRAVGGYRQGMTPLAAIVFAGVPVAAATGIAPPVDQPIRFTIEEVRTENGVTHRFFAHRVVTFHVTPDGFEADMVTTAASADPPDLAATLFLATMGPIGQQPIRFRLDRLGHVTAIADQAPLWATITGAIAHAAQTHGAGTAGVQNGAAIAGALAAMPAPAVTKLLSISAENLVVDRAGIAVLGSRALTVPTSMPGGGHMALSGVETVTISGDRATLAATAAGDAQEPSAKHIDYGLTRVVDRSTGLLVSLTEKRDITVRANGATSTTTAQLTITRE
ncbi:hypothetical protein ACLB0R_11560 [Sphingomonas sp. GlSt437]|uniref:hypothetical protein n=1 Tax=Sphingomonas sp. GlSt437 TaxID=3389970 RepID=UPI003A85B794